MKNKLNRILVVCALAAATPSIEAAGFRELQIDDPGYRNLTVGLWYPSDVPVADQPNTEFELPVALNAPFANSNSGANSNGGLILISHGFGGWYAGHADTAAALADAGFIVAAPSHTGNTWSDMSSTIDQWVLDRPRHISRVIDHVLGDDELNQSFNLESIGVYGFSAGGYTTLGLIGGLPDFDHAAQHCKVQPDEFVCMEGMIDLLRTKKMQDLPAAAWGADRRIKAAVISAPGLGFAYTKASLASVTADVQLWSGEFDKSVPTKTNAAMIARNLPTVPETHWIDKAGHFAFMIVACRDAFKRDDPVEYEEICGDMDGFDRRAFHDDMHKEMVRFFRDSFNAGRLDVSDPQ